MSAVQAQNEQPPGQSIGSTREDSITVGTVPLDTAVPMTYVLLNNNGAATLPFQLALPKLYIALETIQVL